MFLIHCSFGEATTSLGSTCLHLRRNLKARELGATIRLLDSSVSLKFGFVESCLLILQATFLANPYKKLKTLIEYIPNPVIIEVHLGGRSL